jgi:hypothetical protein
VYARERQIGLTLTFTKQVLRPPSSAGGIPAQRAKVVAMLFSGAAEVEEEVPIEGEVELVAGGVDDGGGGTDVGFVDVANV